MRINDTKETEEKFEGKPADFTPQQLDYISRMFDAKGPVLVRMGVKKKTRFYSPREWLKIRDKCFPRKGGR